MLKKGDKVKALRKLEYYDFYRKRDTYFSIEKGNILTVQGCELYEGKIRYFFLNEEEKKYFNYSDVIKIEEWTYNVIRKRSQTRKEP